MFGYFVSIKTQHYQKVTDKNEKISEILAKVCTHVLGPKLGLLRFAEIPI